MPQKKTIRTKARAKAAPQEGSKARPDPTNARRASTSARRHVHHVAEPSYVVGIGASAGGLEALERFFKATPEDSGMAFVVIQHLSPDFKSMMAELLARHTTMKIQPVTQPTALVRDCIYLLPPKQEMVIENGQLCPREKSTDQPLSMPITLFFRSLARECGERVYAIVLSGTGTDGSAGLHDVHDMGGRILVQSEETAKFDGMPRAAIATGLVDAILAPEEMPATLLACAKNPAAPLTGAAGLRSVSEALAGIPAIIDKLRETYGIDFNHYKTATITRRIDRRINMLGCGSFQEYCNRALGDPGELDTLYKDLLIGVTRFFRDAEAFEVIRAKVVPTILDRVPADEEIRVWCPGCATGEEPYSLAIAFLEEMERRGRTPNLKVFASDMHRDSLHLAAEGLYPESSMEEVGPELRQRYFVQEPGGYRVISSLRKALIFSPHNLIKDPPFTKMDLVSCRNLLIYFQPPAQLRSLVSFHFALKVEGFLFLGPSETVGEIQGEFETLDRQWKVYRKVRDSRLPLELRGGGTASSGRAHARMPGPPDTRLNRAYETLMNRFVPTGALINERREVVHLFGQADRFLRPSAGKVSTDILSLARGHLRLALSTALQAAIKKHERIIYSGVEVENELGCTKVTVTVEPVTDRGPAACHYVQFTCEVPAPAEASTSAEPYQPGAQTQARIEQLEHDLQQTKESLQSTVEQLETSNEELQASNEELLAANEELQSTNEELHSVNEELYSVNAEHEQKIHELDETTSDLHNLIRSTDIGTIFVDRDLRIRLFTPTAGKIFNLLPQDVGREITHITYRVLDDDIIGAIRRVINHEIVAERKVLGPDGRRYQRRATAYRDQDNRPAGVVLTFVDVTELTEAEERLRAANESLEHRVQVRTAELLEAQERLREAEAFTRHWLNTTTDGIWDRNLETDEEYLSPSFKALCGYADHELPNHTSTWQRLIHPEDLPRAIEGIREHLLHDAPFVLPVRYRHKNGTIIWVLTRGVAVKAADGRPVRMVGTHTDITELKRGEEALRQLAGQLEARVAERTRALEAANASLSVSELRYRNVTETLPQLVWTSTPEGACDYLGPQWLDYTGLPAVEQLGFGWFNQVHPDDRELASETWRDVLARGGVYDIEMRLRRRDGAYRWFKTRAIPLRDAEHAIVKWFGTSTDIDDLRRSEADARVSEERFREIVEYSPNGIVMVDTQGRITMANPQAAHIFRCTVADLLGSTVESLIPESFRDRHRADRTAFHAAMVARPMGAGRHLSGLRRDGTEFPAEIGLQPLHASGSAGVVATIVDISDRIKAELDLKETLLEKETLLKEIHHRVKNNMQLISSLLRLQSDRVTDAEALTVLQQGQNRVRSLALIHEKLYQSTSLAHIDFKDYLGDLLAIVQSTNGGADARVRTEVHGDPVMLSVDIGVPLGLMVNELVSNSFKHAFPGLRSGRIEVFLRELDARTIEVSVRDDGVGLPPGLDWKHVDSLGLHLVKILSNQIEASTTARSGDGVEFVIRVPLPDDPDS